MSRFASIVTALALAGPLATTALAQSADIGGFYSVRGTNPDGSAYRGTAEIIVTTKNTCRIVWNVGTESSGICMRNGIALAAGYNLGDEIGLVIYEIFDDGTLEGLWTVADRPGVGTETLVPR
jgi:hypothetical protein